MSAASSQQDGDAEFDTSVTRARMADVASTRILLSGTDQARIHVGYDDQGFNVRYDVEDGDNDGVVTVRMNLYTLARDDLSGSVDEIAAESIDTADSSDSVSNVEVEGVNGDPALPDPPLAPSRYEMNASVGGVEISVSTLEVVEPRIDSVDSWTLPGSEFESIDDAGDVRSSANNDELTQDDSIANEDVLLWQIESSSVYGALERAKQSDESYGAAFVEMLGRENTDGASEIDGTDPAIRNDFDFRVVQRDAGGNRDPKELDLVDTHANGGIRVVPDQSNEQLYVLLRTDRMNLDRGTPYDQGGSDEDLSAGAGETYEANFTVAGASNIVSSTTELHDRADVVERSLQFDTGGNGRISVSADAGQEITGTTSVAPGTQLGLEFRSTSGSTFLYDPETTVDGEGRFDTTLDFSNMEEGTEFEASASGFSGTTDGIIESSSRATVTFSDQTVRDSTVTVDSVTMSEGGFVAIHQGSASGDVIGVSTYLEPGELQDVEIPLDTDLASTQTLVAMPHEDTNENQVFEYPDADGPYTNSGSAVTDDATVSVQTYTPTTTAERITSTTTRPVVTTTTEPNTPTTTDSLPNGGSDRTATETETERNDADDEDEEENDEDDESGLPMVPVLGGAFAVLSLAGAGLWQYQRSGTDDDSSGPTAGAAAADEPTDQPPNASGTEQSPSERSGPEQPTGGPQPEQPVAGAQPAQPTGGPHPEQPTGGPHPEHSPTPQQPSNAGAAAAGASGTGPHGDAGATSVAARFAQQCPAVQNVEVSNDSGLIHTYEGTVAADGVEQAATILSLAPEHAENDAIRDGFSQATRQWRGISENTHIATVYESGADPRPWIAFDSGDRRLTSALPTLDEQERVAVVTDVASALRTAGTNGVTHGRLTPYTVHLTEIDGEPVPNTTVSDWGLQQTAQGVLGEVGVTAYTAPEQLTDDRATTGTDMYQLGVLAYHVLTGERPFAGAELLPDAVASGNLRPPTAVDPTLPAAVDEPIQRAMALDPKQRFGSPYDFKQAIIAAMR